MQRGTVRGRTNGRENALSVSQTQLPKLAAFVHNLSLLIIDQEQKVTTRPTYTTHAGRQLTRIVSLWDGSVVEVGFCSPCSFFYCFFCFFSFYISLFTQTHRNGNCTAGPQSCTVKGPRVREPCGRLEPPFDLSRHAHSHRHGTLYSTVHLPLGGRLTQQDGCKSQPNGRANDVQLFPSIDHVSSLWWID